MWWLLVSTALAVVTQGEILGSHEVVLVDAQSDRIEVVLNSRQTGDQRFLIRRDPDTPDRHQVTLIEGGGAGALHAHDALRARVEAHEAQGGGPLVPETLDDDAVPRPAPTAAAPASRSPPAATRQRHRFWSAPDWPRVHGLPLGAGLAALIGAAVALVAGRGRQRWWWWTLVPVLAGMATVLGQLDHAFSSDDQTQRVFAGAHSLGDILAFQYNDQRHPPLLYLLLHGMLPFGHGEAWMRLPAVAAGMASVVALFGLLWRRVGGPTALGIAAIWAMNTEFLARSREVGDHSLFVLLSLLATVAAVRALESPRPARLLAWTGAVLLMLSASFAGVQVWLAHLLVAGLWGVLVARRTADPRAAWGPGLAMAAVPLVGLPLSVQFLRLIAQDAQARAVASDFPTHMWGDLPAVAMFREWLATLGPSAPFFDLVVLGLVLAVALAIRKRHHWLTLLAGTTAVVGLAVSLGSASAVRMKAYYLLFVGPMLLILTGVGLGGSRRRWQRALGGAVLGLLVHGAWTQHAVERGSWKLRTETHWTEIQQLLREEQAGRLVADPNSLHSLLLYYGHPTPLRAHPSCERPPGGWGTRCIQDSVEVWTLTLIPELAAGWEERALDRLRTVPPPFHFVHLSFFENEPVATAVEASCERRGIWEQPGLSVWRCAAGVE